MVCSLHCNATRIHNRLSTSFILVSVYKLIITQGKKTITIMTVTAALCVEMLCIVSFVECTVAITVHVPKIWE